MILDLGFKIRHEVDIRIKDINTPEARGIESVAGKLVSDVVEKWVSDNINKGIICVVYKLDKYGGRAVGDFFVEENGYLSEYLLNHNLCQKYDGTTTKVKFMESDLESISNKAKELLNEKAI